MRWLVVVSLVALAACTVDRKSDTIACSVTSDCTDDNRVCENGYCVKQGSSDCPDHCDACNTAVTPHTCTVTNTGGNDFNCPDGFVCLMTCTAAGSHCGDIDCHGSSQCIISCDGDNSCGDIHCDDACACDVTCTAGGCQDIDVHCPHDGSNYCTTTGTDGPACTSMAGGRCNSC